MTLSNQLQIQCVRNHHRLFICNDAGQSKGGFLKSKTNDLANHVHIMINDSDVVKLRLTQRIIYV